MSDNKEIKEQSLFDNSTTQNQNKESSVKNSKDIIPQKPKKTVKTDFDLDTYLKNNPRAYDLFNSLFSIKGKEYYYSRKLQKIEWVKQRTDLVNLIWLDFPEYVGIREKGQGKGNRYLKIDNVFLSSSFFINTVELVIRNTDLFQEERTLVKRVDNRLYITKNYINILKPKLLTDSKEIYDKVINDYKNHFQELDNIIEWIIGCRFTENRRQSFLHLRVSAGFGKSFWKSIFSDLGILTECRYEDFKSPSGLNSVEFENSLLMLIDEFTIFKKEFKDITNKMILDSKNELRTEVKLYSKIFLSAEESNSFIGGVDKQISDRISQINKEVIELKDREIYKELGNKIYYNIVLNYIYERVKTRLEYFHSLGEIESSNLGEKVLTDFYTKYKLKSKSLEDIIRDNFFNKIYELYDSENYDLSLEDKKIKSNLLVDKEKTYILIKSFKKTFEDIIKGFGEDFYKKSRYKTNDYEKIFQTEIKAYKHNGKTVKGIRFKLDYVKNQVENKKEHKQETMIVTAKELEECPF